MGAEALYGTLLAEGREELAVGGARFALHRFRNLRSGDPALALSVGDVRGSAPLLARVHSSCVTSEALGACDCDCSGQLQAALRELAAHGRGALFYLFQEGRGAGLAAKARDRMAVQASRERVTTFEAYAEMGLAQDQRRYEEVAFLRHLLGSEAPLRLLSQNPEKAKALEDAGVRVAEVVPLAPQLTAWNRHYLAAKSRSGHAIADPGEGPAALPDPLPAVPPAPADAAGRFVRVGRYQLPILLPGRCAPLWLTLELLYDVAARSERVLLAYRARSAACAAPLVCVQRETLLDRFAPGFSGVRKPRWLAALRRFERHGAGLALFVPLGESTPVDEDTLALLASRAGADARPAFPEEEELGGSRGPLAAALGRLRTG
jgi:GTP cyclohydrolase II